MVYFPRYLRKNVSLVLVLIVMLGFASLSTAADFRRLETGKKLPQFSLADLDNNSYSLTDFAGHDALIVLWNIPEIKMHRNYSLEELITAQELANKYREKGLKVLAVYVPRNDDTLDQKEIAEYQSIKEIFSNDLAMPVDSGLKVFNLFGVNATPSTVLVSKNGEITFTMSSYPYSAEKKLKSVVRNQVSSEDTRQARLRSKPKTRKSSARNSQLVRIKKSQNKFPGYKLMELCCASEQTSSAKDRNELIDRLRSNSKSLKKLIKVKPKNQTGSRKL